MQKNMQREAVLQLVFETLHTRPQCHAIIAIHDPESGFRFLSTSPDMVFQMGMIAAAEKALDENYRVGMHEELTQLAQAKAQAELDSKAKKDPGATN